MLKLKRDVEILEEEDIITNTKLFTGTYDNVLEKLNAFLSNTSKITSIDFRVEKITENNLLGVLNYK